MYSIKFPLLQFIVVGLLARRCSRLRLRVGRRRCSGRGGFLLSFLAAGSESINLVLPILLNKVCKVFHCPRAGVFNRRVLGTSGEDLDGRETLNLVRNVVGGRVNLGDRDLGRQGRYIGVEASKLLILRSKTKRNERLVRCQSFREKNGLQTRRRRGSDLLLAVAAPRGIVLNKNVFVILDHKILVVVANNDRDRSLLCLRNRLGLDAGLNLSIENALDERADVLSIDFLGLVKRVLGVLRRVLDGERWELLGVKVEGSGVSTKRFGIDRGDVNCSPVLLGNRSELLCELLSLLFRLRENVCQRNARLFGRKKKALVCRSEERREGSCKHTKM